ncbi:FecR domain-containing protein [Burkholderia anthina]|uniref:FecR family protein n=1 Tax=Burkholderia anthina TaxID=179879 RepID=UPI001CF1BEE8|nr:FecR domain-containing protein [Burkholderia anthina]MCA8095244.1 FecR domain-containing protein [Burkholderia anthina]
MSLSQPDKDEIEFLFVSLWHGEEQEQADARSSLDALKLRSPMHRDYIARQEQENDEISLNAAVLRQRYVRVLSPEPFLVPAQGGAVRYRFPTAWVSGGLMLAAIAAVVVWSVNPVLSRRIGTASIGYQTTLPLDDGSEVLLNTDTSVLYLNRLRSREIILERGEAMFRVAHSAWRPFFVRAGSAEIEDVGTTFSVRRRTNGVDVAVLEGQVAVTPALSSPAVQLAKDQAIRTTGANIEAVNPDALVAWKDRRLDFDNTPLKEVVSELARYRAASIIFVDDRAGQARISGGFSTVDIDRILKTLPQVAAVKVMFRADGTAMIASR